MRRLPRACTRTHLAVQRGVCDGRHRSEPLGGAADSTAPGEAQELAGGQHGDGQLGEQWMSIRVERF